MQFERALFIGLAFFTAATAEARKAQARSGGVYMDILSAEAVGNFAPRTYDVYRRSGSDETFVGNQRVGPNTFLGGGIGLRMVYGARSGLRFSGEGSMAGGRIAGGELPFASTSTALRAEFLGGAGYQVVAGPFVLHAAALLGLDYMSWKVAQPVAQLGSLQTPTLARSTMDNAGDYRLTDFGLRLGAQAGVHLQLAKPIALYGDVTFDYDGQWRARFGFAIGEVKR